MLSFQIVEKMTKELRELVQATAQMQPLLSALDTEELDYIHRNVLISMVGASTRIENAILTDAEIDWIETTLSHDVRTTAYLEKREYIQDKLSKDKERSIDEVTGCRALLQLIYAQAEDMFPLTETTLRGLHGELLRYYAPAAHYRGQYKTSPNNVIQENRRTGERSAVFETCPPGVLTETAMRELVAWYNTTLPEHPWTVAVAVEFVFRFLAIHPFQDGNGRLARGLFLLALLQGPDESLRVVAPYLPIDRSIEKQKEDYYIVLRRCSGGVFQPDPNKYEYAPILRFMLKVIARSLTDFALYRRRYRALRELPMAAVAVLQCFKERPETRLQTRQILEDTGFPRSTATDALRLLKEQGFIQRFGRGAGVRYQLVF